MVVTIAAKLLAGITLVRCYGTVKSHAGSLDSRLSLLENGSLVVRA